MISCFFFKKKSKLRCVWKHWTSYWLLVFNVTVIHKVRAGAWDPCKWKLCRLWRHCAVPTLTYFHPQTSVLKCLWTLTLFFKGPVENLLVKRHKRVTLQMVLMWKHAHLIKTMPYVMFRDNGAEYIYSFIHCFASIGHMLKRKNVHFRHFGSIPSAGQGCQKLQRAHVHNWRWAIAEAGSKRHQS